ncbi:tRNA pseudouridine(55) synthase TruB [Candidatus Uhrbacteria bacterium]|nr:tRNA pseudouridine(55) synthase TruB [Candidatus Uhrbacteria bacterium]
MLFINKPSGPTSHDIVNAVRRKTGVKRVGHAGTLDPFASGLLIVLVGREETRRQSEFLLMDKTYEAVIRLGATSTTDDRTGVITDKPASPPAIKEIESLLLSLVGKQDQIPSQFSAKKVHGVPAYKLARKGAAIELSPKGITIHSIDLLSYAWPLLSVRLHVSSGTYIRAFARDLGELLSCGGYVLELARTRIGPYLLADAQPLTDNLRV